MQKPPPLRRAKDLPITAGLGLLAIACTGLSWFTELDLARLEVDPDLVLLEPWRLVTSALLHADPVHLVFNLYWLWTLGSIVEQAFGHVRTAIFYTVVAAGSALAEMALFEGGIGLSGVGYGLVALVGMLAWRDERYRGAIDGQTILLFVGWFFLCIIATYAGAWRIANVAHGAGAILGAIFGWAVTSSGAQRYAAGGATVAALALFTIGATIARPVINISPDRGQREARAGYEALEDGRPEEARALLARATELAPDNADHWHNLGVACARLGDDEAARDAFDRACRLDRDRCVD
jgi:membrane associated rhomboid family serine protease